MHYFHIESVRVSQIAGVRRRIEHSEIASRKRAVAVEPCRDTAQGEPPSIRLYLAHHADFSAKTHGIRADFFQIGLLEAESFDIILLPNLGFSLVQ